MLDEPQIRNVIGHDVVIDGEGKSIGNLETFFVDRDTGKPEWLDVFTGTFRSHHYLVPVRGAEREGTGVRVPWTKDQVRQAPQYSDPDAPISEELEREAYSHYGVEAVAV